MKKADIRTTATLNIHEKRMRELMDAPEFMAKTDASAAAYREIKDGVWKKEIAAEAARLDNRINKKPVVKTVKERFNEKREELERNMNCGFCKKAIAPGAAVKNVSGRIIHAECIAETDPRDAKIAALEKIVALKDAELDRLLAVNNAGAEQVAELRRDLLTARNLATKFAAQKVNVDFNPGKFAAAPSGRKAEIFDELLDAITKTEFDILKVKVNARAIEIVKADFAERGIEIEW